MIENDKKELMNLALKYGHLDVNQVHETTSSDYTNNSSPRIATAEVKAQQENFFEDLVSHNN